MSEQQGPDRPPTALIERSTDTTHTALDVAVVASQEDWLHVRPFADETTRAYRQDLQAFNAWMEARGLSIHSLTPRLVADYRDELKAKGYAHATIARRLSSVRQALDYAVVAGMLGSNPARLVKGYPVPDVSPRSALSDSAVRVLLAQPQRDTVKGARDYAILLLLTHLALRRREVADLRLEQFGTERGHVTLRFTGKGGKAAVLPVPPRVAEAIRIYLERAGRYDEKEGPLFQPLRNRSTSEGSNRCMNWRSIWKVVVTYARTSGHPELADIDVHTLRLTAITNALDKGASLRRVQALARHADVKTTTRYDTRRGDLDESAAYRIDYGVQE